jgi:hypothetical protein
VPRLPLLVLVLVLVAALAGAGVLTVTVLIGLLLWWVLPTGFAITLAIMGFTLLGVGLEPVLNPRWERGS